MSKLTIHFTRYTSKGKFGDFSTMIHYTRSLFIFNDNIRDFHTYESGNSASLIKQYELGIKGGGMTFGFNTGPSNGGLVELTVEVRQNIIKSCQEFNKIFIDGCFKEIYIPIGPDKMISKGVFPDLSDEVRMYITNKIIDIVVSFCMIKNISSPMLRYYTLDECKLSCVPDIIS